MKPSHLTTPRTLADCTFTYGYTSVHPMAHRNSRWASIGYAAACIAVFAAIGVLLAWRG